VLKVSLIATVLNERDGVREWLELLRGQCRQPNEIVICDGGSTDGTVEELQRLAANCPPAPLKIISLPGANIAAGRNAAIAQAGGDIIAVSDAGARPDANWLAEIVAPFESAPATQAVAGSFRFAAATRFERAAAAYLGQPWLSPSFTPSSRSVAFRKAAWARVGGYPEWLTLAAEDTLFNQSLQAGGVRFVPAPQAIVTWNMRPDPASFLKMIARNAFGDAEAGTGQGAALKTGIKLAVQAASVAILVVFIARWNSLPIGLAAGALAVLAALSAKAFFRKAPVASWPDFFALSLFGGVAYLWGFLKGTLRGRRRPVRS
jgi:glycosyltransferase involved in cell wall biosynthesis